jgi:hypothetical protein
MMNEEPGTSWVLVFSCFLYEDVVTTDVTAGVTLQACAFLKIVKYLTLDSLSIAT